MLSEEEKRLLGNVSHARSMGGVLSVIDVSPFWVQFTDDNSFLVNFGDQEVMKIDKNGVEHHPFVTSEQKLKLLPMKESIFSALKGFDAVLESHEREVDRLITTLLRDENSEVSEALSEDDKKNVLVLLSRLPRLDDSIHVYKKDNALIAEVRHNEGTVNKEFLRYDLVKGVINRSRERVLSLLEQVSDADASKRTLSFIEDLTDSGGFLVQGPELFIPQYGTQQVFQEMTDDEGGKLSLTGHHDGQLRVSYDGAIIGVLQWDEKAQEFRVNHSFHEHHAPLSAFRLMHDAMFSKEAASEDDWRERLNAAILVYENTDHDIFAASCCEDATDTSEW